MPDNDKVSQLVEATSPLVAPDAVDFFIRRGSGNFRVSRDELAKEIQTINNEGVIYLLGDEFTDGSLRIIPDTVDKTDFQFQLRTAGVWNDTGIVVSTSTIFLGRDLEIKGAGDWIKTDSTNIGRVALIPHIAFTDNGTLKPKAPYLDDKVIRQVIQPDDSEEFTGTVLTTVVGNPLSALVSKFYVRTGNTAATQPFLVTIRRGDMPTDPIIWEREFPASALNLPNTEFEFDLLGEVFTFPNADAFVTVTSNAALSIRGNLAGTWWFAIDFASLREADILTDDMIISNDAGMVLANDASFVIGNQFRI